MRCVAFWIVMLPLGLVLSPVIIAADKTIDISKLPPAIDRKIDFEKDIQPVLQRTCYSCHGPEKQEGGLRLDGKERALQGGDNGKVIVPGKSAESRLIQLVTGLDEETGLMPPEGEGTPLTSELIGVLRAWIDQGAHWPDSAPGSSAKVDLWSLKALSSPPVPHVTDRAWVINAIDAFILARLEREKIAPSPPASRTTLLRRAYLDLVGLPPGPEEIAEFISDFRPDAYERLVDRLLASPAFGERWGRHWLDLARYADSDGYEKDRPRPFAWRYRNWVLDAINADLPYDRFTLEQLAGDLLPDTALDQRIATGFHRNTLHNTEGGADPEEDRVKKTVDRTNTVGAIWLGLTVGCAQCHSHKYDPLTQREYYQLYAFFNSLDESDIPAPLENEQEKYQLARTVFDAKHAPYLEAIQRYESDKLAAAQAEWEKTALNASVQWQIVSPISAISKHGATLEKQSDLSLLAKGENQASDIYVLEASFKASALRAVRLEVLPDDSLVKKGPGRADNGNFVLATFKVESLTADGLPARKIPLHNARADFSQGDCEVAKAINENEDDFWAISPQFGKRHVAVFEVQQGKPEDQPAGDKLRITLDQRYLLGSAHNIGRFRLSLTESTAPISFEGMPSEVAMALKVPLPERTAEQAKQVTDYYRTVDPEHVKLTKALNEHAKSAPNPPDTKAQSVAQRSERRPSHIHVRGDFLNPGDPVEPLAPAWLPAIQTRSGQPDRLDLARWLVAAENPLTPRVAVNRWWDKIFGQGIVRTVDDFGKQGELPSHPELLDWLAAEFRTAGWSAKHILRLIVTSNTYRQSSATRSDLLTLDPENFLLARQSRRRVEAEVIRDLSIAASGLIDPRVGGPSVRPPQPSEYANLTYSNSAKWTDSKGGDRYRRGLYTFFQRTSPYPMLITFDSPDSNECCAQRETSNTPLQALTLWNDPVFYECAQSLGRRLASDIQGDSQIPPITRDRIAYAFSLCLSRLPTALEMSETESLFADELAKYAGDSAAAAAAVGKAPLPVGVPVEEVAAWTVVGRVLLNLDEFITRE